MQRPKLQIIPAIDLLEGQVVRLYQGKYEDATLYHTEPALQAKAFAKAGAKLLHIVDLNAARSKTDEDEPRLASNSKAIRAILEAVEGEMEVELGGGLRNMRALESAFALGLRRCIIGTGAVKNPAFLKEALAAYGPQRIIVGVDAQGDKVRISGWEEDGGILVAELLASLEQKGVKQVIFTDIARDGALTGPGSLLFSYIEQCSLEFFLSGGISSIEDIKKLLAKAHPRLLGLICGRAIYEQKLDLRQAVQLCGQASS